MSASSFPSIAAEDDCSMIPSTLCITSWNTASVAIILQTVLLSLSTMATFLRDTLIAMHSNETTASMVRD